MGLQAYSSYNVNVYKSFAYRRRHATLHPHGYQSADNHYQSSQHTKNFTGEYRYARRHITYIFHSVLILLDISNILTTTGRECVQLNLNRDLGSYYLNFVTKCIIA